MKRPNLVNVSALTLACLSAAIVHASGGYFPNTCWVDPTGSYECEPMNFANGASLRNGRITNFNVCTPLPPGGAMGIANGLARYDGELFWPGAGWAPVTGLVQYTARFNHNAVNQFDTELLQLDISGGTFPPGVLVREHPVQQSLGVLNVVPTGGGYQMDGFFDVFPELSVNGGAAWVPGIQVARITLAGPCYANCDQSTSSPILNVNDFSCFLNKFAAGSAYANCDGSTAAPILNVLDFACFLNRFATGCT